MREFIGQLRRDDAINVAVVHMGVHGCATAVEVVRALPDSESEWRPGGEHHPPGTHYEAVKATEDGSVKKGP